jgi:imidazoleglycerol-phosphate dehydratase / histidinol-phosphatase
MKVVFVDRDGTIIKESPDEQIDSLEKLELVPGVITGLRMLINHGFELIMITNQDALGTTRFPGEKFEIVQSKLLRILRGEGILFSSVFICPHTADDDCACRKPRTGLVDSYLKNNHVDLNKSFVLGDRVSDVVLGKNIGCKTIFLRTNLIDAVFQDDSKPDYTTDAFLDACSFILKNERSSSIHRKTNETEINVDITVDGNGLYRIETGLGFFDHMLAQLSRHSSIDITISVKGDLHVDEHHTIEDTGLALGEAIRTALGEKLGIRRYGFLLPMDESLSHTAIDLGGRPYFSFDGTFERERVGDMPTELVEDFFRAFSDGLRANLHISVTGRNDHHKIEAIFKSVARSLKQAVTRDIYQQPILPSTKGVL